MRILISSYSFGAGRGSEAGVGWNIAAGLASRGHEVCVVSTSEFHALNDAALRASNLPIRLVEFDAGITHFNSAQAYRRWQRNVGSELRRLAAESHFDLIHHVTFNQYRSLRDVFEVELPYVIGPIGGAETVHPRFWRELPLSMALKEAVRYLPWDVLPLSLRVLTSRQKGVVLASTPQTAARLTSAGISHVRLSPIISMHDEEIIQGEMKSAQERYFVFDGGTRPEKGMKLMLRALSCLWRDGIRVPVKIAAVNAAAGPGVLQYVNRVGLPREAVDILPFMPRPELLKILAGACGFVSVGFRDAGCMALLEAISLGLPAVCLDVSGQHWLPEEYAIKIPVWGGDVQQRITDAMRELVCRPVKSVEWHQERVKWLREHMSWRVRLDYLEQVYEELIKSHD